MKNLTTNKQEEIRKNLRNFDLLSFLQGKYDLQKVKESSKSITFRCPFHEDKTPSAWIKSDKNGIQRVHCSSPGCKLKEAGGQDAIGILTTMEGISFKDACQILFGNNYHTRNIISKPVAKQPGKEKSQTIDIEKIIKQLDTQALADTLEQLLEEKGFGKYVMQAAGILRKACLGIYTNPQNKAQNLAFAVFDENRKICSLHLRNLPERKPFKGFLTDATGKGYFFFDRQSEIVFIVEGIFKSVALSCLGYSSICTYGTNNVDYCLQIAKKLCPGKRLILLLDSGAENIQKEAMAKHGAEGIFGEKNRPNNFGIDDLLAENPEAFANVIESYIAQLPKHVKHVAESLTKEKNVLNLVSSPTGSGKTHQIYQRIAEHVAREEKATLFTNTINSVDAAMSEFKAMGIRQHVARVVADSDTTETKKKRGNESNAEEIRQINATAYQSYLGLKGHTNEVYAKAGYEYFDKEGNPKIKEGLTTTDFHYCDEFHQIFNAMRVEYPLCKMYVRKEYNGQVWHEPTDDYHNWQKWHICFYPKMKKFNRFEYPAEIQEESLYTNVVPKNIDVLGISWEILNNPKSYKPVHGTLFAIDLPQREIKKELPQPSQEETSICKHFESGYLNAVLDYCYKPRILCQFPILISTGQPISQTDIDRMFNDFYSPELEKALQKHQDESKAKEEATKKARAKVNELIQVPKQVAYIPILTGYNTIPLLQIMRPSPKGKVINAFSATLMPRHKEILHFVAKQIGWTINETLVTNAPIKFIVKANKIARDISLADHARLLAKLIETGFTKSLCVVFKKQNARTVYKATSKMQKKVSFFYERDYETAYLENKGDKCNIVTYHKANILENENMPEHNNAIIDCGIFLPIIALDLDINQTREEINAQMAELSSLLLTQILGRLLRDMEANALREKTDKPIISKKVITLTLHSLPKELAKFQPNESVIADYKEYVETNTFKLFGDDVEQLAKVIDDLHQGKEPENYLNIEARNMAGKPPRELSHSQRENTMRKEEREKHRLEQKLNELMQIVIEGKKNGYSWTKISNENHLRRLSKKEYENLMQVYYRK